MTDFSTRPRRRPSGTADAALLALSVVALALALQAAWSARVEQRHAREVLAHARRDAEAATAKLAGLRRAGGAREELLSRAQLTTAAPPVAILASVAELLPADVRLRSAGLRYGTRVAIELEVTARRPEAYDAFLARLAESGRFSSVVPGPEDGRPELRASVGLEWTEGARP